MTSKAMKSLRRGGGAAILIALIAPLVMGRTAAATEKFAAQTGKPCAQCHNYPAGDLKLTPFGKAFVANGFKLPPERPPAQTSKPPANGATPPK
jgi:hypothetical protein